MAEIGALAQVTEEEEPTEDEQFSTRQKESAEESRQVLREARERITAKKYDKRQMWLAAAQALGSPTRTGQFGETLGNLAGALGPQYAARDQFDQDKEGQLLDIQKALGDVDEQEATSRYRASGKGDYGGAAQRFFESNLEGLEEEEQDLARRIQLGLDPRAVGSADLTTIKDEDTREGMLSYQEEGRERGKFAEMTGASRSRAIDTGFTTIQNIASNMRNVDRAIEALKAGAKTGFFEQYLPSFRASSVELDQIQSQLGLDVIGSVTFGALSKGELDLALATALPTGLDEPQLIDYLERRKVAQNKLIQYYERQIDFLDDGGTVQGFRRKEKEKLEEKKANDIWSEDEDWTYYRDGTKEAKTKKAEGGRIRFQEGGRVKMTEEEMAELEALDEIEDDTPDYPMPEETEPPSQGISPKDRAKLTGMSGVAGGAGGAGLGALYDRIAPMARKGSPAERKVVEAMEMGGTNPAEVMQDTRRGQRLGVPQKPIDVGGPMARVLGEKAMIAGGPEAATALEDLEGRHAESRERVEGQIENKFKTPEYFAEEDKLTSRLYDNARDAYKKAYAENPSVKRPDFWTEMVGNKYGKKAVKNAIELMALEGKKMGKEDALGMVRKPSLEFMDNVKRGFDDVIQKEQRAGNNNKARAIKGMRTKLVNYLDDPKNVSVAYSDARKQYKGDIEVLEALETGRKSYLKMPAEEAKRMLGDMSWAEKNALRAGVTQKLYEQIGAPSSDMDAARKILGSPNTTRSLELLFDKPKDAEIFKAAMRREAEIFQMKKTTGSARRGRDKRMADELLAQDDPIKTGVRVVKKVTVVGSIVGPIIEFLDGNKNMSTEEADEIIKILNEGDNAELQKLETRLTKVAASQAKGKIKHTKSKAGAAGALLGGIGAFLMSGDDEEPDMEAVGQFLEQQQ